MKMLHFTKAKPSFQSILVSLFVILLLMFALFSGYWLGLIGLILPAAFFSVREGVYIDLENKMYRSYLSVFGISKAQWKPLPDGTKIGIRKLKLISRRIKGYSAAEANTLELYLLMPKPEKVVLTMSNRVKKLYRRAQVIHQHLGYEIIVDKRIPRERYA